MFRFWNAYLPRLRYQCLEKKKKQKHVHQFLSQLKFTDDFSGSFNMDYFYHPRNPQRTNVSLSTCAWWYWILVKIQVKTTHLNVIIIHNIICDLFCWFLLYTWHLCVPKGCQSSGVFSWRFKSESVADRFTSSSRFHLRLPLSTCSIRGSHTAWISLK